MRAPLQFLFGSGWWTLWHVLLYLPLLPFAALLSWVHTNDVEPGKGPNGGEFAFAMLAVFGLGMTAATFVNALLVAGTLPGPGIGRYAKVIGLWIAGAVAGWWVLWQLLDRAQYPAWRQVAFWGLVAFAAVLYAGNLLALQRVRGATSSP